MRILGLDIGRRRVGVAVSDPTGLIASSVAVIQRKSTQQLIEQIKKLVVDLEVDEIVVGLPLGTTGEKGPEAQHMMILAARLEREIGLPIALWDESYSTKEAEMMMIEAGRRRKARRRNVDAVAASLILQSYLDSLRSP